MAVQFSVDSLDPDKGGNGMPSSPDMSLPWQVGPPGSQGGLGDFPTFASEELCFDQFLDFESLSNTGDELPDIPDSLLFDGAPVDGSASATSLSDDLDDFVVCHPPPRQQQEQNHQSQSHHQPPSVETRVSATTGPAATSIGRHYAAGLGDLAPHPARGPGPSQGHHHSGSVPPPPPARTQSSSAIARTGEQRNPSTYAAQPLTAAGSESISDSELLRLEGISLKASPIRNPPLAAVSQSKSQPSTPLLRQGQGQSSTNNTTTSRGFFRTVASKIQKAATVRSKAATATSSSSSLSSATGTGITTRPNSKKQHLRSMSTAAVDRPISPATTTTTTSPRKGFKVRPDQQQHMAVADPRLPISPPNSGTIPQGVNAAAFCNGFLEDPFLDPSSIATGMVKHHDPHTPMDTPILDDDKAMYFQHTPHLGSDDQGAAHSSRAAWPLPAESPHLDSRTASAWAHNAFSQPDGLSDSQWWDSPVDLSSVHSQFQAQNARNATFNLALHTQQAAAAENEMAYDYNGGSLPGSAAHEMSGLMIQMPHHAAAGPPSPVVQPGAYTHVPPPHPSGAQTERRPRMPRAPSAGARHLSTPLRRQRPASASRARDSSSASPTPTSRSRHSSGSSATGSGAVMGASVKKRRSWQSAGGRNAHHRTTSAGSNSGLGLGIGLGGDGGGVGFVNFTPSDKNILMTGVAPSGSSKTKARREKEAQEKRRRLSEAALKVVRDAGGDVDVLIKEGFVF